MSIRTGGCVGFLQTGGDFVGTVFDVVVLIEYDLKKLISNLRNENRHNCGNYRGMIGGQFNREKFRISFICRIIIHRGKRSMSLICPSIQHYRKMAISSSND